MAGHWPPLAEGSARFSSSLAKFLLKSQSLLVHMLKSPARNSVTTIVWNLQWNASTNSTTWEHLQISLLKVLNFCSWCKRRSGGVKIFIAHFSNKKHSKNKALSPKTSSQYLGRAPKISASRSAVQLDRERCCNFHYLPFIVFFYHISIDQ